MASMVQKIAQITLQNQNMSYASTIPILSRQIMMCELCGGEHNMGECLNDDMGSKSSMEHVDLVGYGRQQQSFQPQGAYNPNASRNHPGFSWSNPMGAANPQNFGNRGPPPGFQGQQNFRGGEQQQSRPNQGFQAPTTQPRQSSENSPPPNWEAMMEMMFKSQMKSDERLRQLTEKLDQLVGNKRLEKGEEFDALDERYFDEHKRFKKILHEEVGDVAILEKESKVRKIEESEFLFEDGGQILPNKVKDWANNSKLKALIEEYPMAFKTFVERFIEARNWKCLENHPG
nr:uncharacterized protein LOC109152581 [Ipomoea batatas]